MKKGMILIGIGTGIGLASFLAILFGVDPAHTNNFVRALFVLSFILFLTGFLTLLLFFFKQKIFSNYLPAQLVINSLRQAFFISLAIVAIFLSPLIGVSRWLAAGVFSVVIFGGEYFFQKRS